MAGKSNPNLDENLSNVEKFLREHTKTLGKLSELEIAKEQAKTTDALPTQSMTANKREPGTATKASQAVEKLQQETTQIRNEHEELKAKQQIKGPSNTGP